MKSNKLFSVIISLIVALGGFLLGFDSAVISGATPFYKVSFSLDTGSWLIGLSVSAIILGAIVGNIIAGGLANHFGRKRVLIFTALLFAFCAAGTSMAHDIVFFIVARVIGGFGVGMAILIAPMYIAEIAPRKLRGTLVTFNQLNIVLGISIAYFSNYYIQQHVTDPEMKWRWMLGVGLVPAALYFITLFFVPRSPRWLMTKGKDEEAMSVLQRVNGKDQADVEFREIRESLNKDVNQERGSYREVFTKKMTTVLIIGLGIAFFQQITGINAIFYYAPMIFEMAGGGKDAAFMQAIIIGLTNVVMTVVAMFLIDRLGRKPLLIIGSIGITLSLMITGFSFGTAKYELNDQAIEKIRTEIEGGLHPANSVKVTEVLGSIKGKVYSTEVTYFNDIKSGIGQENYNLYKELILKHSITIRSIWVLIGLILYVASFAISLGPVMWALLSEIFPNKLRGAAISVVGFWNSIVSFSVASVFPMELENLGSASTYFLFAAFGFLTLLFVLKFIPETKGKSLEELEALLVK